MLILTARMGAGHDGVARELGRRLGARGFDTELVDVWDLQPAGLGRVVTAFYRTMIRRAPWLYEVIYRIWLRPAPNRRRVPLSPATRWAEHRLLQVVAETDPVAVVTTFHLGTQILGSLRLRGSLQIPTISYCVDFAGHGLWVHPGVDANLCLHPRQAAHLAEQGARGLRFAGPVVPQSFHPDRTRGTACRRRLGIGDGQKLVLVLSGSWGAGRVGATLRALRKLGDRGLYRVVAVTGTNEALRRRLATEHPEATVLGWVDDMEDVLVAADVVVENAGGLSAMEAMAAGVPVVSYLPIPGHGRDNVVAMAQAGVSAYAAEAADLVTMVEELASDSPRRRRLLRAAAAMAAPDPVRAVGEVAVVVPLARPGERRRPPGTRAAGRRWG